jgi:hypothetical protein
MPDRERRRPTGLAGEAGAGHRHEVNMRRWAWIVGVGLLLCGPSAALALGHGALLLHANAGVGFGFENERYSQMQHAAAVFGAGASVRLRPSLRAMLTADHFYFPRSRPKVDTEEHIVWDPSGVSTALVGVELLEPRPTQAGPFTAVGLGLGRIAIGDAHGTALNGLRFTTPGDHVVRPAFAIGAGVRTRPIGRRGPSLQFQLRYVFIAVPGNHASIVPLTLGAVF